MGTTAGCDNLTKPILTTHALRRMQNRHITEVDVMTVMEYGRSYHVRGAVIYAMGRRDVAACREVGLSGERRLAGVQVVCAEDTEVVITVYRNSDFHALRRKETDRRQSRQFGCNNCLGV